MIFFARPEALYLLLLLPLWLLVRGGKGGAPALRYSSARLAGVAARGARSRVLGLAPLLRVPAVGLLVLALAEPSLGRAETAVRTSGIDILLALDVSASMEAADMAEEEGPPRTRLDVARDVVAGFIEARPNDRIGLVAFAGEAYLVGPLTLDHAWLVSQVRALETGRIEDGTAIGAALATSVERIAREDVRSRVVVLLSDGANNAGAIQPPLAAEAARALGVKVYTVGLGSARRARIPIRDGSRTRFVHADVAVDEGALIAVAETTGGRFFRARDAASLEAVYAEIDAMERTERVIERVERREPRAAPLVTAGLGLLGLELFVALGLVRRVP